MDNLSLAQQYVLCSFSEKGKIPFMGIEVQVGILAATLLELLNHKCIILNHNKKVEISSHLKEEVNYTKALYDFINNEPAMTIEKLAEEFTFNLNGHKLRKLTNEIGNALVIKDCAVFETGGFGKKHYYIPDLDSVDEVIDNIRDQAIHKKTFTKESIMLITLLEKSHQLKRYFNKEEKVQIIMGLKDMRKTYNENQNDDMLRMLDTVVNGVISATL